MRTDTLIRFVLWLVLLILVAGCVSQKLPNELTYRSFMNRHPEMREYIFTAEQYRAMLETRRKAFKKMGKKLVTGEFKIRSQTRIRIEVFGYSEFDKTVLVNSDGRFDYFGEIINVPARNKTIDELRTYLTEALSVYILDPKVTLNMDEGFGSINAATSFTGEIAVVGEVGAPGVYAYDGEDTLFDLIHRADGLNQEGEWGEVAVIRRESGLGHPIVIVCDANKFYQARTIDFALQDIELQQKDIVFVPKNLTVYEHFERDLGTFVRLIKDVQSIDTFDERIIQNRLFNGGSD